MHKIQFTLYCSAFNFIKYKNNFLGTPTNLIGFVKHSLAKSVKNNIKYENFTIIKNNNELIIDYPFKLKKPINKKNLAIISRTFEGSFNYTTVLNMPLCLIDEIEVDKNLKLISKTNLIFRFKPHISDADRSELLNKIIMSTKSFEPI